MNKKLLINQFQLENFAIKDWEQMLDNVSDLTLKQFSTIYFFGFPWVKLKNTTKLQDELLKTVAICNCLCGTRLFLYDAIQNKTQKLDVKADISSS